jgi:hypothetical protein
MKRGRAGAMTDDYKRHGTTTLFAALDVLEGKVSAAACESIGTRESIRFPNHVDAAIPPRKAVHVILDNYA